MRPTGQWVWLVLSWARGIHPCCQCAVWCLIDQLSSLIWMSLLHASLSLFIYVLRSMEVLKIDLLLETEKQAFLFKLNWVSGEGRRSLVLGRQTRDWLQLESRILFVIIDLPCENHWLSDLVAFKVPWKREKEIVCLDRKFCLEKSMLACDCGGKYLCVHVYACITCVPLCVSVCMQVQVVSDLSTVVSASGDPSAPSLQWPLLHDLWEPPTEIKMALHFFLIWAHLYWWLRVPHCSDILFII